MSALPVSDMPLDAKRTEQLHTAVGGLSAQQLQWISGYVAGLAAAGNATVTAPFANANEIVPTTAGQSLTVLYGSQTGNGEAVAIALAESANAEGVPAKAISLAEYKPSALKREAVVTFVISTHGEGEPPDDAEIFREFLLSKKAPSLENLKYSVLALGDSSYVNFCQTGREFDARLAELGAQRLEPMTECDLDYDDAAAAWASRVTASLTDLLEVPTPAATPHLHAVSSETRYDRKNRFPAEVLVNQKITGGASSKDVRHIELSLEGSGITYEPGDALAVVVRNPPQLVTELMQVLALDSQVPVIVNGESLLLQDALTSRLEITASNLNFLKGWAKLGSADELSALLVQDDQSLLTAFMDSHQIVDVVRKFPASVSAQDFVDLLRKLAARSYSISSSLDANPEEVHITVAAVRYTAFDRAHWGAASTHLSDRIEEGDEVLVYVEKNKRFRLPQPDVATIMIGPGTGVAPFRAFMEERKEAQAPGKNWLFFGDRNFDSDFLYQLEWQRYLKQGVLTRLDVAFSRDQRQKVYVQDRIRQNAADIYQWLQEGAVLYVCGDAKQMAGDVHEALIDVVAAQSGKNREEAEQVLKDLRAENRYQRDVY